MSDCKIYFYILFPFIVFYILAISYNFLVIIHTEKEYSNYRNTLPINRTYHGYQLDCAGIASWYDYDYPKGSGNWVTKEKFVAASRDFPRGTMLRVCNKGILDTNSFPTDCVVVTVTDYGPEAKTGRIIDMGSLAFSKVCALKYGTCKVLIKKIE